MIEVLCDYVWLFFAFAIMGWIIEVVGKWFEYKRFINRGFLIGPYCPIYGVAAVLLTLCIGGLSNFEYSYGMTYTISFFVCGAVEYFVSWILEKRYHARWWDYTRRPMNLNGRVWIGNLILFGFGGVAIIKIFNPLYLKIFHLMGPAVRESICGGLVTVFAADLVFSMFILKLVKAGVEKSEADNTEEISKEIRLLLSDRTLFHRRFANAFPEVVYKTDKIAKRMEEIKLESERLRKEAEEKLDQLGDKLTEVLEPTGKVKSTIIEKQGMLIEMMYDDETASDDAKQLKSEIEKKMKVLHARHAK